MHYLPSVIFFLFGQSLVGGVSQFKDDASKFMEVGFNKGRMGTRLAEIAVKVRPTQMFEEGEDLDVEEDLVLEVKSGDGCWTQVDESPVRRGKDKRMWRVKVVPCKEHVVRLGLKKDGCVEYLQYPESVGPATAEEIANSHFRPSTPEDIVIAALTGDSVVVSWTSSPCAESYELWYESHDEDDSGNMTVSAGFGSVTVRGLKDCTDYTMYVTAMVGDEFSNAGDAYFTTCQTSGEIHEIVAAVQPEDAANTCKQMFKECELIVPTTIEEDQSVVNVTEATFEMKSDPEARIGRANSSSRLVLGSLWVVMMLIAW